MEEARSKRTDAFRERHGASNKKRSLHEKKTKSDTTFSSGSSLTDPSVESIVVVGKSCNFVKSKSHESGYRLHECHSETAICPLKENQKLKEVIPTEGVKSVASNLSFISAKSNLSSNDALPKKIQEAEEKVCSQSNKIKCLKNIFDKQETKYNSVCTETDETFDDSGNCEVKLKDMEKKIIVKERKIKELNQKVEEFWKAKNLQIEENKGLTYQVNLLNRQLHSMYELIGKKNWNDSVDPVELASCKNKIAELEALIVTQEDSKKELKSNFERITLSLMSKEKELNAKTRELVEYKNRSTLELCKLINQVDYLQKEAKTQSQLLDAKISDTQNFMESEIVTITQKLEDQYQKDIKSAIEKFHSDFEQLSSLPKSAIEKLLQLCEPNKIDLIAFQKEWDKQQTILEAKIMSMQSDHNKEIMQLKDSYESKIVFLKTQVESLSSQLKEKKEILDIFENELMIYKSNSSMNLLRAASKDNDISSLKELYAAEIFSQKQVHKLEVNIFEEKVKALTEEILYHAKTEEIHLQELENAKKMAYAFREKYEQLVFEWEERIEKGFKIISNDVSGRPELDRVVLQLKKLINSLKKSEEVHEERILKLEMSHENELGSYVRDVEIFKNKLYQLEKFQETQTNLDNTIQDLIKSLSINYTKTVDALLTSHETELSLKQLEMYSTEKRHSEEIISLKNKKEKEIIELQNKLKHLQESKNIIEKELDLIKKNSNFEEVNALKKKIEEISLELLKHEGIIAVKEEMEQALVNRIKELENLIKLKEENCRKELEDLVAKFLEVKVLSSAKDELVKELEEKLSNSEKLLEKSCLEVDKICRTCFLLEENLGKLEIFQSNNIEDFKSNAEFDCKFSMVKANGEQLKIQLLEVIEKIDFLEKENRLLENESWEVPKKIEADLTLFKEKNILLEEEKIKVLDENQKLKIENNNLLNGIIEKEKSKLEIEKEREKMLVEECTNMKNKLEVFEEEKKQLLINQELILAEKNEIFEKNEALEENVRILNDRIDLLLTELANNKGPEGDGIFSISLQEVRVLYQEEQETELELNRAITTSTVGCQVRLIDSESFENLKFLKSYDDLCGENENLEIELVEKVSIEEMEQISKSRAFFDEELMLKFKNMQIELCDVINERDELLSISKSLEKDKNYLKEEIENLKEENYMIQASCEAKIKILAEKSGCSFDENSRITEFKISEMKKEMEKLRDYIKKLSSQLDIMKADNESLLNESHEHLRNNQNLVSELEEAWSQRYEIEDQLAKVRKENALLNLHRNQLQETNRRISSLVAEGKPSIVSWIKIHETVENVVDEILALKMSFSDSGSVSSTSTALDVPKTTSKMKLMAETLHTQLQNKTILCDELMIQKETLENELKRLENLLKLGDSSILNEKVIEDKISSKDFGNKKISLDFQNKQSINYPLEKQPALEVSVSHQKLGCLMKNSEDTQLMTLNSLKKHLENQVELEEAQFRETLELEIKDLKKEMQKLDEKFTDKCSSSIETVADENEIVALLEVKYEEEVLEITKEFEKGVEKLKAIFAEEKNHEGTEKLSHEAKERYSVEIDKLKSYFEVKWNDLEKKYQEIYDTRKQKRLNSITDNKRNKVLDQFQRIFEEDNKEEQKIKAENFLKEILKNHREEVELLKTKYKEDLNKIETNHISEIQNLKVVVFQLKENTEAALKREEQERLETLKEKWKEEIDKKHEVVLQRVRNEFEEKLEEEKKRFSDLLEEIKQKHEKEMFDLEEFWMEKLSDCETKCALIKAIREKKTDNKTSCEDSFKMKIDDNHLEKNKSSLSVNTEQNIAEEVSNSEKKYIEKSKKEVQPNTESHSILSGFILEEKKSEKSFCPSCLSSQSYFGKMEVKTDDDKLEIVRERDTLKEMVFSLRFIVTKLLSFIGQHRTELNNTSLGDFDNEETMYKSILTDLDRTTSDLSVTSNTVPFTLDMSNFNQEINENSFLNSSDQVRFELDRCLKLVKKDATSLLALSCPETTNRNLFELIKKLEKEKNELVAKVCKTEEIQDDIKKEINMTKERLSQWERNLEVVSEGYGEEVVEPKKIFSLSDLKNKIKFFLGDQQLEINLLDEIFKEGDRLQEEWKREKIDLLQQGRCSNMISGVQIDVADKQVHSLKKFLEEQAAEREQEREAFDKEIGQLKENIKAKEKENLLQNRTNREGGHTIVVPLTYNRVEALEFQLKDLANRLESTEKDKAAIDTEFQNAVKKIWSLREVIQDLEFQLAEVSERELNLKKKADNLGTSLEEQIKVNKELKEEFEISRNNNEIKYTDHIKNLEEELSNLRRVADQINSEALTQLKMNLREIEGILVKKTRDLEQVHVSSANVSCSSPSEDVSLRDQLDATRCSTPDEMFSNPLPENFLLPVEEVDRLHEKLARHNRAEEVAMKCIRDLKMQMRNNRKAFEEVQTERDVLLEKVDVYLKENSSLKVRLEEQRCNAGLLQKQLNANLESQINRLEIDVEKLNELCIEKDKQLRDIKEILENTTKTLKIRETEVLNKSKEENTLISTLKTDLANALNENQKLEEKYEKMKEKLRESLKMPALIDSMIEEKNAEIDRLEKEVTRLSSEISSLSTPKSDGFVNPLKQKKQIRFSEPDSFGECISSISAQNPSLIRNYSDSFSDFKHSPFKIRQCSTKLDSVSSIGALQLSPRGNNPSIMWKTSSPIVYANEEIKIQQKSPSIKAENDFQKMVEESKLKDEIDAKQREISELNLEIDILKRQIVEINQELTNARSQSKEILNDIMTKDEEIRKLKNNENSLLISIETLKKNQSEEVEELQSKLNFEHGKVEKVYEEIKALEVKKIEIEEAFLSLREDYNEKLNGEQKMVETLMSQIKDLEHKNEKLTSVKEELEKESVKAFQKLMNEITQLKEENENLKIMCTNITKSSTKILADAEIQVEEDKKSCEICQKMLTLEMPKIEGDLNSFKENLEKLKEEYEKIAEVLNEKDFSKIEVFSYAVVVKQLLSCILSNVSELYEELESHRKRVMECSVDDLAVKVKKELVLSAKLDNKLLSSIKANGLATKDSTQAPFEVLENSCKEIGAGDNIFVVPKQDNLVDENILKAERVSKELVNKVTDLENLKIILETKIAEQQKIIKVLEDSLSKEKERILKEEKRCIEDAKIMELLRINLEKGLQDMKSKERDLKKEKQQRMLLEKEIETFRKQKINEPESKKVLDLNCQLESQKEKLASIRHVLEEEKKKSQELKLLLEQSKIDMISEKNTQRLLESDLSLVREQKENLKIELIKARKILNSRNIEIGLLKRKLNLQEIDIKALSLSNEYHRQSTSETSSIINKFESFDDILLEKDNVNHTKKKSKSLTYEEMPPTLLAKMKKLNTCVQRHVKESNEMGEALLYLSQETEQMRDIIKQLEENNETKLSDKTLVADLELEKRLWSLEKGGFVMDIETLKREQEILKRDLIETCKSNDILKIENTQLKREAELAKEDFSNQIESGILQDRISHLTRKFMRAESYRKALAWQKNYLLITIGEYRRSEEEAWKKIGGMSKKKRETKGRTCKRSGKFRIVALAIMAIFRMRFIVKRWQRFALTNFYTPPGSRGVKLAPLASVLNIYNEPVNPLSYQTQNIIRSSSKVLRTPPSRDPGLQGYSVDAKKVSECLDTLNYFKENIGIANVLP